MKLLLILATLAFSFAADVFAQPGPAPIARPRPQYAEGQMYVKFTLDAEITIDALRAHATGIAEVDALLDGYGVYRVDEFDPNAKKFEACVHHGIDRMYVLYFAKENDSRSVAYAFKALGSVESVSPRYLATPTLTPNDKHWGSLWGLKQGKMNVEGAWNVATGDPNTVIAVLDFGVNYTHEDLAPNIYNNPGETGKDNNNNDKRTNGIDDDGDGFVDNWCGVDLMGNDSTEVPTPDGDPMPDATSANHGTMVAGCAAAKVNNGKGVAGTGFNCSLMPVKVGNAQYLYVGWDGIEYAYTHGAKIIVCSWVQEIEPDFIPPFIDIIDAAAEMGSLVVGAAGNYSTDNDISPYYPACIPAVLSVGSTQDDDKPASSGSNFGHTVDVFAPGQAILTTTLPENDSYTVNSGTSFATPYVGGIAGLIATKYPEWTPKFIARQIIETCDNVVNPVKRDKYWGRVNAFRAVTEATYPGLVITDFSVDSVPKGLLNYINKEYALDVRFKNVVTTGNVTVMLLDAPDYLPVQYVEVLNGFETGTERTARYTFKRDPLEYVKPGRDIKLVFYATDGNRYKDTLVIYVRVAKDLQWSQGAVSIDNSSDLSVTTWPNPATALTTVRFTLTEAQELRVALVDQLGRKVRQTKQQVYPAGMNEIGLDLTGLPGGMYTYVLESRSGLAVSKQLVIAQ